MERNRQITRNYLAARAKQEEEESMSKNQRLTTSNWEQATTDTLMQPHHAAHTAQTSNEKPVQSSVMESELKSLQSKIMDLENKLSFTNNEDSSKDVAEDLLKNGIVLPSDPF